MIDKYEDIKTMGIGAILSIPYTLSLIAPTFKNSSSDPDSWIFGSPFVYTTVLIGSALSGVSYAYS